MKCVLLLGSVLAVGLALWLISAPQGVARVVEALLLLWVGGAFLVGSTVVGSLDELLPPPAGTETREPEVGR